MGSENSAGKIDVAFLVKRAKKKDKDAFVKLYEMVYKDLYRTAYYTLGNREDAENVVSDTVLDAYTGIESLRDDSKFKPWIFGILSNHLKAQIRYYQKQRTYAAEEAIEEMPLADSVSETEMERLVDSAVIEQAFKVLNEEEKLIVTMTVFGGYDSKEIADKLELNRNTVRSKYKRALAKMKTNLTKGE